VVKNVETPAANEINAYHRAGRQKPHDRRRDGQVYVQHLEPTRPQYLSPFYLDPKWTNNVQDPALNNRYIRRLRPQPRSRLQASALRDVPSLGMLRRFPRHLPHPKCRSGGIGRRARFRTPKTLGSESLGGLLGGAFAQ
jgi:hypothetical protein